MISTLKHLALGLLIVASCSVQANTINKDNVKAAIDHFLDGATHNDPSVHDQFWAEDLTYTSSSGKRFGKAELMQGVLAAGPIDAENVEVVYTAEEVEIKPIGDAAIVNFILVASTDNNAGYTRTTYYNTGVLIWADNRWQALNWNATTRAEGI